MSTLFIAGAILVTLLFGSGYYLTKILKFVIDEIHFDEAEQEQLNQDFKGGLRNVRR
jgi:hypothetical protein|tara:strand:+ start:1894 stop:2064 length:171 start_codon:yes stop_codon:yes gene_type:complete